MDIVASIIKALFGSKADKDRKQIEPYLEKIKAVYPSIENSPTTNCERTAKRSKSRSPTSSPRTRPASSS